MLSEIQSLAGGRFRLGAELGSGAFGQVHRAYDRVQRREVALKLLHKRDPESLARFKREFRSVAALRHPHLVALHSLHREGDRWFFTMDLVEGFDLMPYVRPAGVLDPERARRAFREMAEGLIALHQSGHVHRDVKPSNVRLDLDGSVRLLDFGFARDVDSRSSEHLVGTPLFMAPEVIEGASATPASDWYAFGVVLYECLSGRAPFEGRSMEIMLRKRAMAAPPLPDPDLLGLRDLVAALLDRDPSRRPGPRSILEALGDPDPVHRAPVSGTFIGRGTELEALDDALERMVGGQSATVWIEGEAGAGKTALLDHFLRGARERHPRTCVLRGRCFPREALPYKGLDAAVDALAHHLHRWSTEARESVLPVHMGPLLALFPVLGRIASRERRPVGYELSQIRVEAFASLRTLLASVAEREPLVLALDDLQWADEEGLALLRELMRPPTPPILFIGAHRPGPFRSPGLVTLQEESRGSTLCLSGLDPAAATGLARTLLGDDANESSARRIATEASGNPLFVELLARHGPGTSMAEALDRTLLTLEPQTRALLECLCIAGRPLGVDIVGAAAGLTSESIGPTFDVLHARRLVTVDDTRETPVAGAYHDRIAELVVAAMGPAPLRSAHLALARVLAERGGDPEAIAYHFDRAGEPRRATEWMERAARLAEKALAWERASELYRRAIEQRSRDGDPIAGLQIALGDALAHAGRSAEAVSAYRGALPGARSGEVAVPEEEVLRRIAEQLLRSGRMKEGVSTLDRCLAILGLRFPRHPAEAVATIVALRAKLRLRGLEFERTPEPAIAPGTLQRIDLCWSAGVGLSFVDSLRGAGFLTRSLIEALDAGEPYRIARSLAYESSFLANQGSKGERRAQATLERAARLADGLGDPHLRALIPGAHCLIEFHNGRWRRALRRSDEAVSRFTEDAVGMAKEVFTVQLLGAASLVFLGELGQLSERMDQVLRVAELRRDLFALTSFRSGFTNALWLAKDDPARARREATEAFRGWEPDEYLIQHFFDLWAQTQIDLYEGDAVTAAARVRTGWKHLRRSLLMRLQFLRVSAHDLAGRALIAAGLDRAGHRQLTKHVTALRKERIAWARPLADVLESGALRAKGERRAAEHKLAEAAVRFDAVDMGCHAAATRYFHGLSEGGTVGEERRARAEEALVRRGVHTPARWVRIALADPELLRS
ncbi:MAG: protein kinase [Deltaproteobacteria bacterium]|nr:protein kinase [Deltaproteobacteria bacterium]